MGKRVSKDEITRRVLITALTRSGQLADWLTTMPDEQRHLLEASMAAMAREGLRRRHPAQVAAARAVQIAARTRFRDRHAPPPEEPFQ